MADPNIAIQKVLVTEGGFVDNPNDKGGATNFGITQAEYELWVGHPVTVDDIKNMSVQEAKAIYQKNYWEALSLDQVQDQNVADALMDQCVNRGVPTMALHLQLVLRSLGYAVGTDGKIGPHTLQALNSANPRQILFALFVDAQKYYVNIVLHDNNELEFLPEWITRSQSLIKTLV